MSSMYFGGPGLHELSSRRLSTSTLLLPAHEPARVNSLDRALMTGALLLPTLPPQSEIVRSAAVKVKRERSTHQWHRRRLVLSSKELGFSRVHDEHVLEQVLSRNVGTSLTFARVASICFLYALAGTLCAAGQLARQDDSCSFELAIGELPPFHFSWLVLRGAWQGAHRECLWGGEGVACSVLHDRSIPSLSGKRVVSWQIPIMSIKDAVSAADDSWVVTPPPPLTPPPPIRGSTGDRGHAACVELGQGAREKAPLGQQPAFLPVCLQHNSKTARFTDSTKGRARWPYCFDP